ncbi:MAG: TonB family protein, partial [Burkholderiales bacterium]
GGGGGSWEAAVALHITRALQRDPRTRTADGSVKVVVEIDPRGRFISAKLLSSTGDQTLDADISAVLAELAPMNRGRPPGVGARTNLTINLKRTGG